MKIATLGPQGTYAEQAVRRFAVRLGIAPEDLEIIYTTVNNSLRLVQNHAADYALVPVENMIDGFIGATFDALIEFHDFVKVCDEVHLPISHVLAGPQGTQWELVKRIYSHPSPLNQCQNYLEENFPQVALIPVLSTAEAARQAIADPSRTTAAICSPANAQSHQMEIYDGAIQDYAWNETRFLICGLTDGRPSGEDRTLLAVRYGSNQPGQLYHTARYLAESQVDLTFVHSRPYKIKPQEYVLIFEFIGHKAQPEIETALRNIETQVRTSGGWKEILGSYPKRGKDE